MSQTIVRSPIPFVRRDIGQGLSATPQRRGRLLWALLLFPLVGAAWFLFGISPWQGWILSDDSVPYLMATEPWRVQDLYFWRTVRFGSVYVTFWKALARPIFGDGAAPFYLGHALVFFAGLAFWWRALGRTLTRLLFVGMLFPVSEYAVRHFLFPGHLYGMLFFLSGVFAYFLSRPFSLFSGAAMGFTAALTYWQHQLAGVVVALIFAGAWLGSRSTGMIMGQESGRSGRGFLFFFTGGVVLCELARQAVKQWHVDVHYTFHGLGEAWRNGIDLLGRGLPWGNSPLLGWLLAVALLVGVWQLWAHRPRDAAWQEEDGGQSARQLAGGGVSFLLALALAVFIISFAAHYTRNERADRYFLFLVPFAVFFALKGVERAPRLLSVGLGALAFFMFVLHQGGQLFGSVVLSPSIEAREARWDGLQRQIKGMGLEGCQGYLGQYRRNGYVFAPLTAGAILSSAGDYSRNPEYLKKVLGVSRLCVTPYLGQPVLEAQLSGHSCRLGVSGMRVCWPTQGIQPEFTSE